MYLLLASFTKSTRYFLSLGFISLWSQQALPFQNRAWLVGSHVPLAWMVMKPPSAGLSRDTPCVNKRVEEWASAWVGGWVRADRTREWVEWSDVLKGVRRRNTQNEPYKSRAQPRSSHTRAAPSPRAMPPFPRSCWGGRRAPGGRCGGPARGRGATAACSLAGGCCGCHRRPPPPRPRARQPGKGTGGAAWSVSGVYVAWLSIGRSVKGIENEKCNGRAAA